MRPKLWQPWILWVCGCGLVAGLDDFQPPLPDGSGGEGGSTLPACDGGVCMPPIPTGWSGPVCADLFAPATGGTCGAVWTDETHFGGLGDPGGAVQCEACDCGAASGGTCEVTLHVHDSTGCGSEVYSAQLTGDCSLVATGQSVHITTEVAGGSCTASGGAVTSMPDDFDNWARACELPTAPPPCTGGTEGLCVPLQDNCGYCIWREGDVPCPPGAYAINAPVVVTTATSDGRACSPCACNSPTGGSCSTGNARICNASQCFQLNCVGVSTSGACLDYSDFSYATASAPGVSSEGDCTPSGGAPEGQVTIDSQVTLCCAT